MSLSGQHVWPSNVTKLNWPPDGVTYSYEYHKYIKPEKLARWLETFGPGKGKYVIQNQRVYVKAPRTPTDDELRWLQDEDRDSGVQVKGYGWLTLSGPPPQNA